MKKSKNSNNPHKNTKAIQLLIGLFLTILLVLYGQTYRRQVHKSFENPNIVIGGSTVISAEMGWPVVYGSEGMRYCSSLELCAPNPYEFQHTSRTKQLANIFLLSAPFIIGALLYLVSLNAKSAKASK